jgi:hypothetical protein
VQAGLLLSVQDCLAALTGCRLHATHALLPLLLQAAMEYKTVETRLHVWMLLDNIDIVPDSDPACWQNRTIRYPTQVYGRPHDAARSTHSESAFSFSFGHLPNALVLPPSAETASFSIFNTTLTELPQGPNPRASTTPGRLPPDVFTVLLWSINRCVSLNSLPISSVGTLRWAQSAFKLPCLLSDSQSAHCACVLVPGALFAADTLCCRQEQHNGRCAGAGRHHVCATARV